MRKREAGIHKCLLATTHAIQKSISKAQISYPKRIASRSITYIISSSITQRCARRTMILCHKKTSTIDAGQIALHVMSIVPYKVNHAAGITMKENSITDNSMTDNSITDNFIFSTQGTLRYNSRIIAQFGAFVHLSWNEEHLSAAVKTFLKVCDGRNHSNVGQLMIIKADEPISLHLLATCHQYSLPVLNVPPR